jgi:hypothetical protein
MVSDNKLRRLTKVTTHVSLFFVRNSKYRKVLYKNYVKP